MRCSLQEIKTLNDLEYKLSRYAEDFNLILDNFLNGLNCEPKILGESLKYSLSAGGKRIRPAMMFAAGELLHIERSCLEQYALALELIHTYSLIHDDLPEMDNDDFRRGKPSNHKVYGAGNAVLAGDGLLNTAYSILLAQCRKGGNSVSAAEFICDCAGIYGMIAGQSADLLYEADAQADEKMLGFIYANKTAKMLTAPLVVPSILADGKYYSELKLFGMNFGCLFQLTDDILDVEGDFATLGKTAGKDKKGDKCTAVKLFGLEGAKLRADMLADKCLKILNCIDGDTCFFEELVQYVLSRNS